MQHRGRHHGGGGHGGHNNQQHHQTGGAEESSIYFSGAPQSVTERQIRTLFETLGHVQGLRLLPNKQKPIMDGYVDFSDASDARAAVERLNGHLFAPSSAATAAEAASVIGGEYKLIVQLASAKRNKRNRQGGPMGGPGGRNQGGESEDDENGYATGPPLAVPEHYRDPVSQALRRVSMSDAYEAVEQLRVISIEKPEETKELLEQHPALKVAVIEILQIAGRLPQHLPQEAFKQYTTNNIRSVIRQEENRHRYGNTAGAGTIVGAATAANAAVAGAPTRSGLLAGAQQALDMQAQLRQQHGGGGTTLLPPSLMPAASSSAALGGGANAAAPASPTTTTTNAPPKFTTDELLAQVEKLTEQQLAKLMAMKPEDLDKVPEPKRSLLKAVQQHLLS